MEANWNSEGKRLYTHLAPPFNILVYLLCFVENNGERRAGIPYLYIFSMQKRKKSSTFWTHVTSEVTQTWQH